jgi:GT2 family glycosyltransferase
MVARAVRSILLNQYPHFNLIVVDQSDDRSSQEALKPFLPALHLRYERTAKRGLAAGRNLGIAESRTELIALTDDDCETPTTWLCDLVGAFAVDPRIGIVHGNVLPGPHDRTAGCIPSYVRKEPYLARHLSEKHQVGGIGACMAIRRTVWEALGGFDEMLGAGAPFKSAEELDFTIRALLAGYYVHETPKVSVVHYGFHTFGETRSLIQDHLYGIGAMFARLLKSRHWRVVQVMFQLACRWAFGQPAVDFGHRPRRFLRLQAFMQGLLDGLLVPIGKERSSRSASP